MLKWGVNEWMDYLLDVLKKAKAKSAETKI
jgi:hypothetical protein